MFVYRLHTCLLAFALVVSLIALPLPAVSQTPASRVSAQITTASQATLPGSHPTVVDVYRSGAHERFDTSHWNEAGVQPERRAGTEPAAIGCLTAGSSFVAVPRNASTLVFACASLCFLGASRFCRRRLALCCVSVLTLASGLALSGCGRSGTTTASSTSSESNAATGTYAITLMGQDSGSASLSASTTLTLSIQ